MTDKKDEIQAHMIAAIEKSFSIEQMQIRLESLTDTEANLTGFGKDRKLPKDALIYSPTAGPKPPDLRTSAH